MPVSESDYVLDASDQSNFESMATSTTTATTLSKAELRKTHKPIMEKRRRAKINNCLNEIKDLILAAMKKDPERHSKLEKADILEMAVKHLKGVQRQQKELAIRSDPSAALKYKTGYLECAGEVSSYVEQLAGVEAGLAHRLTKHLTACANSVDQPRFPTFASSSLLASFAAQSRFAKAEEASGSAAPDTARIELIPSCLPNGDLAFLLPKSSFSSMLGDAGESGTRPSAFVSVTPRRSAAPDPGPSRASGLLSPPPSPPPVEVLRPRAERPSVSLEIQHIKFPIHNARKDVATEPLCVITNGGERYRHAQQLDEGRRGEENVFLGLGLSLKRKARDEGPPSVKVARIERLEGAGSACSAFRKLTPARADDSDDNNDEQGEPMWRPW